MRGLPAGAVTLLVTDIEGSSGLWQDAPTGMDAALRKHDELLHAAVHGSGGVVASETGDGILAAFSSSRAAVQAAVRAQRDLHAEDWPTPRPVRVRMGVHAAAELHPRRGNYHGHDVNVAARIAALGHGGQVLLSRAAAGAVDGMPDGRTGSLGHVRLAGLRGRHEVLQLVADGLPGEFPPLRTTSDEDDVARPDLRAYLLGPTRIEVHDRVVDHWPRPAARRLVTVLLLSSQRHRRREELVDLLFGHLEPDAASRALSKALSQARSVLDDPARPSVLSSDAAGIRLRDDLGIDVDLTTLAEALRDALAMAPGGARTASLHEVLATDGEPLADDADEPWADHPRREIAALRDRARRRLAEDTDAPEAWSRVVAEAPTDESAASHLVTLHLATGRRDAALQVYDTCARALREELGLEPSRRLRAAIAPALADAAPAGPEPAEMAGRDFELAHLAERVVTSAPTTLVVAGEAGMGKSLLLAHLRSRLQGQGWRTVAAVSVPDDRRLPFVALRGALRPLARNLDAPPLVRRLLTDTTRGPTPVDASDAAALAADLEAFLAAAGQVEPVALFLDDLQWADRQTQQLVARLAVPGRTGRWALVAGWRTGESDAADPPVGTGGHALHLAPLPDAVLRELVAREAERLASTTVDAIVDRAGGNPFFAVELTRAAAAAGERATVTLPARLVDALGHRLAARSKTAQRLAALIALAGEDATHDRLLTAARILQLADDEPAMVDATEELERADLVRWVDGGLRVRHPLLRDVAAATLSPVRQSLLHRALAEAIADEGGHTARISEARHRLAAYEASRLRELACAAVRSGLAAGHAARAIAGHEVAVGLLQAALAIEPLLTTADRNALHEETVAGLLALGTMLVETREEDAAETVLRRALEVAATPDARAEAWCQLANVPYRRGDFDRAVAVHEQGIADVGDDPLARARLEGELGWTQVRVGHHDQGIERLRAVCPVLEESGDWPAAARALDRLGASVALADDSGDSVAEALALLGRARRLFQRANLPVDVAIVQMHRARPLERLGHSDEADDALAEAFRLARRGGAVYTESTTHWAAADLADGRGDLVGALAHRDAEAELLRRCHNDHNLAGCEAHRSELLHRLGRDDEAAAAAVAALAAAERSGHDRLLVELNARLSPAGR